MFHSVHRDISVCLAGNPETQRDDLWRNWFSSASVVIRDLDVGDALRTKTSIIVAAVVSKRFFVFYTLHAVSPLSKQVVLGVFISLIALLQSDLCPHFTSGWRYWLPGWADHGSAHRNRGAAEESVCKAPGRGHGELVSPVLLLFTACNRILCISVSEGFFSPLLLVPLAILKCKPQVQSSGQLIWDHFAREREYPTTCGTLLSHWTVKPHLTRAQD